jgi:hypothetical protein
MRSLLESKTVVDKPKMTPEGGINGNEYIGYKLLQMGCILHSRETRLCTTGGTKGSLAANFRRVDGFTSGFSKKGISTAEHI